MAIHSKLNTGPILNQLNPVQLSYPISFRSSLMFFPLYLNLPRGLLPWGFPTKTFQYVCNMSHPSHSPWFNHPFSIRWSVVESHLNVWWEGIQPPCENLQLSTFFNYCSQIPLKYDNYTHLPLCRTQTNVTVSTHFL